MVKVRCIHEETLEKLEETLETLLNEEGLSTKDIIVIPGISSILFSILVIWNVNYLKNVN